VRLLQVAPQGHLGEAALSAHGAGLRVDAPFGGFLAECEAIQHLLEKEKNII
jgi:hypothetical protein